MTTLLVTVLVASLAGSLHCAGMCGAFIAIAIGGERGRKHASAQAAYHVGRLVTYAALGAIAGGLGSALDLTGAALGVQRAALVVAGAGMVVFGTIAVLRVNGVKVPRAPLPRAFRSVVTRGQVRALALPPVARAGTIGLMTTLLPCGWLYAFAVVAAGTGAPLAGAATMAVFWAGTLPVMTSVGACVGAVSGPLRRHVPTITAVVLVAVGLLTIAGRFDVPALVVDGDVAALGVDANVARAAALDTEEMPCCAPLP